MLACEQLFRRAAPQKEGTSKRTANRKRKAAAEAVRETEAPVRIIPKVKGEKKARVYAKDRLAAGRANWPKDRTDCDARLGNVKDLLADGRRNYFTCQICRSLGKPRKAAQVYCKDCHKFACKEACLDDYHGKYQHSEAYIPVSSPLTKKNATKKAKKK